MKCVSQNVMGMVSWSYRCTTRGCLSLSRKVFEVASCVFRGVSSFLPCFSSKRQIALPSKNGAPNSQKMTSSFARNANLGRRKTLLKEDPNHGPSTSLFSRQESPVVDGFPQDFPAFSFGSEDENDGDIQRAIEQSKRDLPQDRNALDAAPDYKRGELDDAEHQKALWAELQSGKRGESADGGEELIPFIEEDSNLQRAIEVNKGEIFPEKNILNEAPDFVMDPAELELQQARLIELQSGNLGESADWQKGPIPSIYEDRDDPNFQRVLEASLLEGIPLSGPSRALSSGLKEREEDSEILSTLEKSKAENFGEEREMQDEEFAVALGCDQSRAELTAQKTEKQQKIIDWQREVFELNKKIEESKSSDKKMILVLGKIGFEKNVAEQNKCASWTEEKLLQFEKRFDVSAKALLDEEVISSPKNLYEPIYLKLLQDAENFISDLSESQTKSLSCLNEDYEDYHRQLATITSLMESVKFWQDLRRHIRSNQQKASSSGSSSSESNFEEIEEKPPVFLEKEIQAIRNLLRPEASREDLQKYLAENCSAVNVKGTSLGTVQELHEKVKRGFGEIFEGFPEFGTIVKYLQLGELYRKTASLSSEVGLASESFKVRKTMDIQLDILAASKEAGKIHVFSLPSQFNGCEAKTMLSSSGKAMEVSEYDRTQGPLGQRTNPKLFELVDAYLGNKGFNMLAYVLNEKSLGCLEHGYLMPSSDAETKELIDANWDRLEMPCFTSLPENGGKYPVHFLLTAAPAYGRYSKYNVESEQEIQNLKNVTGRVALANFTMQFEYALSLAKEHPDEVVSLHLAVTGLGVFGNDPETIGMALQRATGIFQKHVIENEIKNIEVTFEIYKDDFKDSISSASKCARAAGLELIGE